MEAVCTDAQNDKCSLTWDNVYYRAGLITRNVLFQTRIDGGPIRLYGIPRGGIYAAMLVKHEFVVLRSSNEVYIVQNPEEADVFVDDIVDSGATRASFKKRYPTKPFLSLYDKTGEDNGRGWLVFPWEALNEEMGPEENIRRVLEYIGEDVAREGLLETPERVVRSWDHLFGGYSTNPESIIKVFEDDTTDEMVLLKDIEFYSTCEHHMLPFFGKAHIAYIPSNKVVGISKLARVLEVYARRLQIQERLCQQITTLLDEKLQPLGSACILEAQHFCMTSRGVEKQNSIMTTSSLTGVFREKAMARAELFQMIR